MSDPSDPPPPKAKGKGRPKGSRGLLKRDKPGTSRDAEAAAGRLDSLLEKRGSRRSNLSLRPPKLPFEATLAFAFRGVGGKKTAIEYARLAAQVEPRFKKLVWAYDELSAMDQEKIRLEDLCAGAEILPTEFLGMIAQVAYSHNLDVANIIAAVHHPRIVEATIANAIENPYGTEDRKMLHAHHNFVPQPKGTTISINNQPQAIAAANSKIVAMEGTGGLPSFETEGIEIAQAIRGDEGRGVVISSPSQALPPGQALPPAEHVIDVTAEEISDPPEAEGV